MQQEEATIYTANCYYDEPASCSFACPFELDIRNFLERIQKGKWTSAYKMLRNATVFPSVAAALCDAPCQSRCQRRQLGDEPLALPELENACLRLTKSLDATTYTIPPKSERVAVVGAGPTGLAAALLLAQKKFPVTIFEKTAAYGGCLRQDPRFGEFAADIDRQFAAVSVEFRYHTEITSLDELKDYQLIYVATGHDGRDFGLLKSWDHELLCCERPGVFLGGGLCGVSLMEGIAQSKRLSKYGEVYLQTGKAARTYGDYDRHYCGHELDHSGAAKAPRVQPADGSAYTAEEARAEASRCLVCACDRCLQSCEMLKNFRKNPHKISLEVFTDSHTNPPFSSHMLTRQTYSCTDCGHCRAVCPENIDLGELFHFSRSDRVSTGTDPTALHDFWLRQYDFATGEAALAALPGTAESCEYVFFPGCQLGAAQPRHVVQAYDALRQKYDVGLLLDCCGAPAYWAGHDLRLSAQRDRLRQLWQSWGEPTFICACATCQRMLRRLLPEIPQVSLYELLEVGGDSPYEEAVVFDPCSARDDEAVQSAVRRLARGAGASLRELPEKYRCCGYGGQIQVANPRLYNEITDNRADQSPLPYITYCANCQDVFRERGKASSHILDLLFGADGEAPRPTLAQRRANSLKLKREMMKTMTGTDFIPRTQPWDGLELVIDSAVQDGMEQRMISADDLREAIFKAEQSGQTFYDPQDDATVCNLVREVLTYWVKYRPLAGSGREILAAYYHRMHFQEEV